MPLTGGLYSGGGWQWCHLPLWSTVSTARCTGGGSRLSCQASVTELPLASVTRPTGDVPWVVATTQGRWVPTTLWPAEGWPPKVWVPRTWGYVTLHGRGDFANVIKLGSWDGERTVDYRVGWMKSQGSLWEEGRRVRVRGDGTRQAEVSMTGPRATGCEQPPESPEEARNWFSPRASWSNTVPSAPWH